VPSYEISYTLEPGAFFSEAAVPRFESRDLRGSAPITQFSIEGPNVLIRCSASDKLTAQRRANVFVERVARLLSLKTFRFVTVRFEGLDSTSGAFGGSILKALMVRWWEDGYDPKKRLSGDMGTACREATLTEPRLDKATAYYQAGVFYRRELFHLLKLDPDTSRNEFYLVEATLNFYKTAAIVLGDPIHHATFRSLGLERRQRKRIERLYNLRDRHDVAHPNVDPAALKTVAAEVSSAQAIAGEVLERALQTVLQGQLVQWPPSERGTRRRRI